MSNSNHKRELEYTSDSEHPWEKANQTGQEVYQATVRPEPQVKIPGEFLFGRSLKWYWQILLWPVFILLLSEILIRIVSSQYLVNLSDDWFEWLINLLRLGIFAWLVILAQKQDLQVEKKQLYTLTVITGLIAGFVLAIFQLFWYQFEIWTIFNLIGQPMLLVLEGMLACFITLEIKKKV